MERTKILLLIVVATLLSVTVGCRGGGGSSSDPARGFDVATRIIFGNGMEIPQTARVQGQFQFANGSTVGNVESFDRFSNAGFARIDFARVPGRWRFAAFNFGFGQCPGVIAAERDVSSGQTVTLRCQTLFGAFSVAPNSVDYQARPASVTVTGDPVDTTYGMPNIAYYDEYGYMVDYQPSMAVSGDRRILTVATPGDSDIPNGTYTVVVNQRASDGQEYGVGAAQISVYNSSYVPYEPPPDPDPCGCEPGRPCMPCTY